MNGAFRVGIRDGSARWRVVVSCSYGALLARRVDAAVGDRALLADGLPLELLESGRADLQHQDQDFGDALSRPVEPTTRAFWRS